jgi:hypothetical protein
LETIKTHNKTLIVIIDSQVLYHGLMKGRSNAVRINRVAGITAGKKETTWIGWIPSEINWGEHSSRLRHWNLEETLSVLTTIVNQWHHVPGLHMKTTRESVAYNMLHRREHREKRESEEHKFTSREASLKEVESLGNP